MQEDAIRRRLETLNRGPLPARSSATVANTSKKKRTRPVLSATPRCSVVPPIPGLVRRGEVVATEAGEHLRIRLHLEALWPGGERLVRLRHANLAKRRPAQPAPQIDQAPDPQHELDELLAGFPSNLLLLDLETCGLSGSALFLIGLLRQIDGRLTIELLLARNYAEERAVLTSFWQAIGQHQVLVTFNGKSFDWPMLMDRTARHLLLRHTRPPDLLHVDLLHHSRRRWRQQLPDCKLQTLERHICRRGRSDDIPGGQIPAAYQEFVRTGHQREMDAILLHNGLDLVTLLDLAIRLAA